MLHAQQFSFPMVFVDAAGNRDTLILGYDNNATNAIDVGFGEQNINSTPYNSTLDARAGNNWWKAHASSQAYLQGKDPFVDAFINATPMQTKTQVVKNTNSCYPGAIWQGSFKTEVPIIELNIRTNNWPVTAHWDRDAFKEPCRNGTVFTDMHPGGWWDGGLTSFKAELPQRDSFVFSFNSQNTITYGTEKIPVYWLAFGDTSLSFDDLEMEWLLHIPSTTAKAELRIFPNPVRDVLTIQHADVQTAEIHNALGQVVMTATTATVDVSKLQSGIHYITVNTSTGAKTTSRFVKQ
jgi:hypothetical protein